jgi:hypothetical protein
MVRKMEMLRSMDYGESGKLRQLKEDEIYE